MHKHKLILALLLSISLSLLPMHMYVSADPVNIPDLNAQWVANTVKITFNANGGSGIAPADQIYVYGVERSLPGQGQMVKAGYVFLGWAQTSTATVPEFRAGDCSHTAFGYASADAKTSKTLYAVWEVNDTATASSILSGYTAHINGTKTTGSYNAPSSTIYLINNQLRYEGYLAVSTLDYKNNKLTNVLSLNISGTTRGSVNGLGTFSIPSGTGNGNATFTATYYTQVYYPSGSYLSANSGQSTNLGNNAFYIIFK